MKYYVDEEGNRYLVHRASGEHILIESSTESSTGGVSDPNQSDDNQEDD